ncbi:ABC transporter permease [Frankia sp. CNm7]|uniref:ABC transporter permease n=1 Tax=Frankia nepalensis TaxID=1836974 RepID=A0A937RGR2_9ACTN|nr:ABC transporter permease [Frankia nepalensis]MBL7496164.1 ABC transporter permease [Frankia nepalensis]MBL7508898.1 ABC transporter permease [Frankia nepalensis]MBL7516738.1 ABC transporter permease [Frankia nepalensis]MBL7628675.1 ABC transporter permease [Frankia nepalensis]
MTGTRAFATEQVLVRAPGRAERDPTGSARRRAVLEIGLATGVPLLLLGLWQAASGLGWIDARLYPSPIDIVRTGGEMLGDGQLWGDIWHTTARVLAGFAIGTAAGILFGLAMGSVRLIQVALEPTLDALYVVPKLALLPVFLTMFGLGEGPKIALVAVTVFFFVWISTMSAIIAVEDGYREAGRCFGANRWQMFRHVLVPAALPQMFVAMRVAAGVAFLVIIAAEFIVGDNGLGYLIFQSRTLFINDQMFVGIVVVAIEGVLFAELVRAVGRRVTRWAPTDHERVRS